MTDQFAVEDNAMIESWMKRALAGTVLFSLMMSWSFSAWSQVDEIVVTVRKKSESLQDVPMSVTAFSAADIERRGIKDITDVARFSTSIQFDESFAQSDTRIAVRGLSPTRGRQNVALLVDGIDVSSEAITSSGGSLLLNTRLVDIERIDVVLGPQMALYGRSAFAGAIQYITKDAAKEFEADLKVDAGYNDGSKARQFEAIAGISSPVLGDALGFRLNGAVWDDQGFHRNTITNDRIGGANGYGVALTLNSDIGDSLSMKFRAEFTDDEGQPSPQAFLLYNTELDVPQNAFAVGAAECFPGFVDALGAIPGNNQALLDRGLRLLDPAYVATLDPATLDPNSPLFVPPAGGGPYCEERTPVRIGRIPGGDSLAINLAPNALTPGADFKGFDRELLRLSFVADYEIGNFTLKSLTGFTRDDNTEEQDSNAYAFASAEAGAFLDGNVNSFATNNDKVTEIFSQDIFVTTSFDGPVNGLFGALYWQEEVANRSRSITAQASGSHCLWGSVTADLDPLGGAAGPNSCIGYTAVPAAPYLVAASPFRQEHPADRDTEHYSIYGALDFDLAENWTLAFEGRYNHEEVEVFGPIFFEPGAGGGPGGLNPCGIFFRPCQPFEEWKADGNWFSDSFFPWIDEAPDGTDLDRWVPDQEALNAIPDLCRQTNAAGVARSITHGPILIEREADGTPVWQEVNGAGVVVPILDGRGNAIPTAGGTDTFNPWCVDQLSDTDSWFSPKVRLEWTASDDMLFYFSWSRARKPGGFSLLTVGSSGLDRELAEFDPEKMEVWEIGGNTAWRDNTIVANGALFYQDFTDKQALTSAPAADGLRRVSKIVNAGKAEVWGGEISISWNPYSEFLGGNWRSNVGWTWLPTREYTDFTVDTTSPTTSAAAGNCTPNGGVCTVSYTGNKLENSAEHAVNGFVQYLIPVMESVNVFVETDALWQSKRYTGITNNLWTDDFLEFNLRIGLQGDRWEALLYVENVFDDDTVRSSGGAPGLGCCFILGSGIDVQGDPSVPRAVVMVDLPGTATAFLPDPRIVGARISYSFGGN